MFYEGLRLWEAHLYVFYEDLRLWEVVLLTKLCGQVGPLKKDPHGRGGRGRGWGAGIIMSSSDVGSYEFKRSPCEMQMEECSGPLARSTSDGSADSIESLSLVSYYYYYYYYYYYHYYPPTHRWSCVVEEHRLNSYDPTSLELK